MEGYVRPSEHFLDTLGGHASGRLWLPGSSQSPLPRPDPDAALDRIAAQVIRSKAKPAPSTTRSRPLEGVRRCLSDESVAQRSSGRLHPRHGLGTTVRNALGTRLDASVSPTRAKPPLIFCKPIMIQKCCVTLAHWYLEDGAAGPSRGLGQQSR